MKHRWWLFVFFVFIMISSLVGLIVLDKASSTVSAILGFIVVVSLIVLVLIGLKIWGIEFQLGSPDNESTHIHERLLRQRSAPLQGTWPVRYDSTRRPSRRSGRFEQDYHQADKKDYDNVVSLFPSEDDDPSDDDGA